MSSRLSVKKKMLVYILAFMPFLTIASFLMPGIVNKFFRVYVLAVSMLYIAYYIKRQYITRADFIFFSFQVAILFSTVINAGDLTHQIYRMVTVIGFIAMFKTNLRDDPRLFLKAVCIYGVTLSVLTALTMFIYYVPGEYKGGMRPDVGMRLDYGRRVSGNQYLMGVDNVSFFYIFTILIIFCVYELNYKKKLSKLFYGTYIFIAAAFVYVRSATAILCFAAGAVIILLVNERDFVLKLFSFVNYRLGLFAVVAFFVLIVWLRRQDIFEFLIVGVLGKSMTLTRRTQIWDFALREIVQRPLFGTGLQTDAYNFALFRVNHVHNVIMELLYEGGFVTLILFIGGVVGYCRELARLKNQKILFVLSGGVIVYLLCACLDFYPHIFLPYSLFLLCENAHVLSSREIL